MSVVTVSSIQAELVQLRNEYSSERRKLRDTCAKLDGEQRRQCEVFYRARADQAFDQLRALFGEHLHNGTLPDPPELTLVSGPDALAEPVICAEPAPGPSWLHRLLTWPGQRLVEAGLWLYLLVHPHEEQPR